MIHKGGGAPLPWLLDQPEHVVVALIRRTNAILDDLEGDE